MGRGSSSVLLRNEISKLVLPAAAHQWLWYILATQSHQGA